MELSENERMMLVKKKEEISDITGQIFDIYQEPSNKNEVLKKITQILSILSTIASYSHSDRDFNNLTLDAIYIDERYSSEGKRLITESHIRKFCYFANSITFEFTKDGLKIILPEKIEIPIFKTKLI